MTAIKRILFILLATYGCSSLEHTTTTVNDSPYKYLIDSFDNGKTYSKGWSYDSIKIDTWFYFFSEVDTLQKIEVFDSSGRIMEAYKYYEQGNLWHARMYDTSKLIFECYLKESGDTQYLFQPIESLLYSVQEFHQGNIPAMKGYLQWDENQYIQVGKWFWLSPEGDTLRTKFYD